LDELELAYAALREDPDFKKELDSYADYVGRPTPLYFAERLTKECGGAQIWLKREDLAHTGAHKINNARPFSIYRIRNYPPSTDSSFKKKNLQWDKL